MRCFAEENPALGPVLTEPERIRLGSCLPTTGPYFAVTANDASGHMLTQSATVHIASG